jgi:hypothetical protein
MKHNPNSRRSRNRGNGKRHSSVRTQTFESNGPEGKIRGTAQQVLDKYLALGRDASSAGDPISAESFFQHAEHYFRLLHAEAQDGERDFMRGSRLSPANPAEPLGQPEEYKGNGQEPADSDVEQLPF